MKVDEIKPLVNAEPFRPFYVCTADGGRLLVKHPDFVAFSPTGRSMHIYAPTNSDDYSVVDTALVTRLDPALRNGASKQK